MSGHVGVVLLTSDIPCIRVLASLKMKIGYGRASTLDQNPNLQRGALEVTGCEKMIVDQSSGTVEKWPPRILRHL